MSCWVDSVIYSAHAHTECMCMDITPSMYSMDSIASFPGLHAQLLLLAVRKAEEGLDGLITWCVPRLTSRTVASHDQSSSNRTRRTNWTERTDWIQGKKREQTQTCADWTWRQQRHASRDKSIQAFPRFSSQKQQKLGVEAWEQGYTSQEQPSYKTKPIVHLWWLTCASFLLLLGL